MSARKINRIFTKKDVLKAAEIWDENPGLRGFRVGTRYEVRIKNKVYPPKAIASIANELATKEKLYPRDFPGALDGRWHRALAAASAEFRPVLRTFDPSGNGKKEKQKSRNALETIDEAASFLEGTERKSFEEHTRRERDPKIIKLAKRAAKQNKGQLSCAVCDFNFGKMYGERGDGYIEGHHTTPIAQMNKRGEKTKINDIALVCSNCHRMLHRMRPLITIDQLKEQIKAKSLKKQVLSLK